MNAGIVQNTAQVDEIRTVQLKLVDGSTPRWCQAKLQGKVVIPGKMIVPTRFTLMERPILDFPRLNAQLLHKCFQRGLSQAG